MLLRNRTLEKKPGRTAKITEPMNAVEIAEIAELADLDLVTGGCARCATVPDPQQQQLQNPFPRR